MLIDQSTRAGFTGSPEPSRKEDCFDYYHAEVARLTNSGDTTLDAASLQMLSS